MPAGNLANMAADIDATADELYTLPPGQFVAQRDAAARAARADGPAAVKAIRALKKPSTAAWLLNQLVRANPDDVRSLVDLGAALRHAQSRLEGTQLRELSKQRRQAVNALVREARQLAVRLGKPASESVAREIERSLEAALTSADAAQAVESGRLTTTITPDAGFDSAGPHLHVVREEKQEAGRRAAAKSAAATQRTNRAREAVAALKHAEKGAARAATDVRRATTQRDEAVARVSDLTERIADLTQQLQRLEDQLTDAKRAERETRAALTAAERASHRADLAVEAARGNLPDA